MQQYGQAKHKNYVPNSSIKIDTRLNTQNWVSFILDLRKYSPSHFPECYEVVKYQKKVIYTYPNAPEPVERGDATSVDVSALKIYEAQMKIIMEVAMKHDLACNKAVDMLMSPKYMDDEIRNKVEEHPLYEYVLANIDPPRELCLQYCIGQTIYRVQNGSQS